MIQAWMFLLVSAMVIFSCWVVNVRWERYWMNPLHLIQSPVFRTWPCPAHLCLMCTHTLIHSHPHNHIDTHIHTHRDINTHRCILTHPFRNIHRHALTYIYIQWHIHIETAYSRTVSLPEDTRQGHTSRHGCSHTWNNFSALILLINFYSLSRACLKCDLLWEATLGWLPLFWLPLPSCPALSTASLSRWRWPLYYFSLLTRSFLRPRLISPSSSSSGLAWPLVGVYCSDLTLLTASLNIPAVPSATSLHMLCAGWPSLPCPFQQTDFCSSVKSQLWCPLLREVSSVWSDMLPTPVTPQIQLFVCTTVHYDSLSYTRSSSRAVCLIHLCISSCC